MSQFVMEIVNYSYDPETKSGIVVAMLDDFLIRYPATYEFPEEYGPGLGEANFTLGDDEEIPEDETELEMFFEDLDLIWRQVDNSDYDD
jgi:hypothetical protein